MRPVRRGGSPNAAGYRAYGDAYRDLVERVGRCCSFCEAPLKNGHVEHALPKVLYPELELAWDNFLLACVNCNSTKGDWPLRVPKVPGERVGRDASLWPDLDNTALAYEYRRHRPPRVRPGLDPAHEALALSLLVHTGVDKHPEHPLFSPRDDRWELRMEAWDKALGCRDDLAAQDDPLHRRRIAELARATGFWSVWCAVFAGDADMLGRLHDAFEGTDPSCFDPATLHPRPGARGRV
jgi:hypothetical protein